MAFTVQDFEDLVRIVEEHPEWRSRLRQLVLTQDLLELPDLVRRLAEAQERAYEEFAEYRRLTDQRIAELTASVQRLSEEFAEYRRTTDQRIAELTASVQRLSEGLQQLREEFAEYRRLTDQRIAELAEAQRRTEEQVAELVAVLRDAVQRLERLETWQRGEAGRRDGERYEQETLARAPALFYGGTGGGRGEPHIREILSKWLAPLYRQGVNIDKHSDPLLADIIWWKGGRVMVTEVSLKVDSQDVRRAAARAKTLRQVGIDAIPVVIGEKWATAATQTLAQIEGVEWMVNGKLSKGFIEFRQIAE